MFVTENTGFQLNPFVSCSDVDIQQLYDGSHDTCVRIQTASVPELSLFTDSPDIFITVPYNSSFSGCPTMFNVNVTMVISQPIMNQVLGVYIATGLTLSDLETSSIYGKMNSCVGNDIQSDTRRHYICHCDDLCAVLVTLRNPGYGVTIDICEIETYW